MIVSLVISAIFQVILFTAVPFVYWLLTSRKIISFIRWIGLKKPQNVSSNRFIVFFAGTVVIFSCSGLIASSFLDTQTLASSQFYGVGYAGLIPALIYSFVQTSLSEEILFRGFIGKRLGAKLGFGTGNVIQAFLFGLVHAVMLYGSAGLLRSLIVLLLTGAVGWSIGVINEKLSGGSILPGWMLHGVTNFISAVVMMYKLM
ncbi:CPBP family intramembrane glutamic endopeptidase [Fontibacillus sp. BL9]|uniref:CPBP family intramembrane glutamic endopeptidase n=1 Tax=Fontibacillus sp. BL9 TaxID=3389971 RepID=UPI003979BE76